MKYSTNDGHRDYPKELGINFGRIPHSSVNADLTDVKVMDVFYPAENETDPNSRYDIYFEGSELIYLDDCFKLYTNNPDHYFTKHNLAQPFLNLRHKVERLNTKI